MPEPTQPWPRTQHMPAAIVGQHAQPWHYLAIAEYDITRGEVTEIRRTAAGQYTYTAAQVNRAIEWWNRRADLLAESLDTGFDAHAEVSLRLANEAFDAVAETWPAE